MYLEFSKELKSGYIYLEVISLEIIFKAINMVF